MRKGILTVLVVSLFAVEASAYTLKETFERTVSAEGAREVRVDNTNGDIEVSSWERPEVKVEAMREIKARNAKLAKEYAQEAKIEVERVGKAIEVRTLYPDVKEIGGFWRQLFGGRKPQISVQYMIYVPRRIALDLRTTNGQVRASEVEGEVRAGSTNGKIRIARATGSVTCRTTNGGIELREIYGAVEASTTNGGIEADLAGSNGETCRLQTVNGGITLSVPEDLSADIDAQTVNGSITLSVPEDLSADIDAQTVNGSIRSDLPLTVEGEIGKKRLRGRLNEGGVRISMRAVNGSLRIERR